jgi:shikimate kinase
MLKSNNIFLVGPMGAGKTTIGTYLAKGLQMQFFDSDQVIEARSGVDIRWIFDVEGEEGFRRREITIVDELTLMRGIVLATGGGTVLSEENRRNLTARGVVVYLETSLDQQMDRVEYDRKRPLIQDGNRQEILKKLRAEREPLYREVADHVFPTDERSVRSVAEELLRFFQQNMTKGLIE